MPYPVVLSKAKVQQHEREDQQYVEYQRAVNALNEELDCAGDGFVSCEGYEVAMDMVKVKRKRGTVDEEKYGGLLFVFSPLNSSLALVFSFLNTLEVTSNLMIILMGF